MRCFPLVFWGCLLVMILSIAVITFIPLAVWPDGPRYEVFFLIGCVLVGSLAACLRRKNG